MWGSRRMLLLQLRAGQTFRLPSLNGAIFGGIKSGSAVKFSEFFLRKTF